MPPFARPDANQSIGRLTNKKEFPMTSDLYKDAISKITQAVRSMLEEHKDGISETIVKVMEQKESGKIKIPLSFAISLSPMGDTCGVKVKLSYGEKTKDEVETTADATPELGI